MTTPETPRSRALRPSRAFFRYAEAHNLTRPMQRLLLYSLGPLSRDSLASAVGLSAADLVDLQVAFEVHTGQSLEEAARLLSGSARELRGR